MRGISRATSYLLSGMFLLVFVPGTSWAQVSDKFLNEAKTLAKLEDGFFKILKEITCIVSSHSKYSCITFLMFMHIV